MSLATNRAHSATVVACLSMGALFGACGSGSGPISSIVPGSGATPATDAPAPATDAPATNPPDTAAPATPPPDTASPPATIPTPDNDDSTDWWPIALAIGLGVLLLIILAAVLGRRSGSSRTSAQPTDSPQSSLLSTGQWVHDQLTLELLAAPPAAASQRWATERTRLDNLAIGAQQQWSQGHGDTWKQLGQTTSQLASSIDTTLQLRNQAPPDAALIQESSAIVNRHRAELQALLAAMWPSVRR